MEPVALSRWASRGIPSRKTLSTEPRLLVTVRSHPLGGRGSPGPFAHARLPRPRSRPGVSSRTEPGPRPPRRGRTWAWSSLHAREHRSSPATSAAPSTPGAPKQASAASGSMTPGIHAGRCWPRSTFTRASPCRSSGTARSASRWRSTPKYLTPAPERRCGGWETVSHDSYCCTFVLYGP